MSNSGNLTDQEIEKLSSPHQISHYKQSVAILDQRLAAVTKELNDTKYDWEEERGEKNAEIAVLNSEISELKLE